MTKTIYNTDSVIDSRDIIERIEELEENKMLGEGLENADIMLSEDEEAELKDLKDLAEQCEGYGDWKHGETLIHRSYFEQYIDEMIADCYTLPKDLPSFMSIVLNYDMLEQDYMIVYFDGEEYLMRSC